MVLVVSLHVPLCPVHHLALRLPKVPLGELELGDESIGGLSVDLGEELDEPAGHIEPLLVVQVVLGVHELLPLRLSLLAGC